MRRDALAHLVVERLGRGDEGAAIAEPACELQSEVAFAGSDAAADEDDARGHQGFLSTDEFAARIANLAIAGRVGCT
jgi:hypothetical protein